MNFYSISSKAYDILDKTYFKETGSNPREVVESMISDSSVKILDLCCGTLSNTLSVAERYPNAKVVGVDISKSMLTVARDKYRKKDLSNVYLRCTDATSTGFKDKTFDYIIIGLVLHESSPELREGILREAYRLLKDDGKLIVLEWEKQDSIASRIKFAPLYLMEIINCKTFKEFYLCDREAYFKQFHFHTVEEVHCNYSIVMSLQKV